MHNSLYNSYMLFYVSCIYLYLTNIGAPEPYFEDNFAT